MIVTVGSLAEICQKLSQTGEYGVDTETTGLLQSDSIFSIIISTEDEVYYFNLQEYPDLNPEYLLPREQTFVELRRVFENYDSVFYIHNAKFDWRMLAKEGITINGTLWCTYAVERVIRNNYFGKEAYQLSGLAKRRGLEKDDAVDNYITEHKLWTPVKMPGKKKIIKLKHFDRVPFEIISKYGEKDGYLHRYIGLDQRRQLEEFEKEKPEYHPSFFPVVENEIQLTKTCFNMERTGIKIDRKFVSTALEYELEQIKKYEKEFTEFTGEKFVDSNRPLQIVFDKLGESYPLTEKGNPSFADDVLEEMDSPVAALVNRIRHHDKRASTYYSSFLFYATNQDILHADMRQASTESGRFSYRDPNLQNVPKEADEEDLATPYHVRESFIPREGLVFHSIDYRQMELVLMHDYAGELGMIKRINAGEDCHAATAEEVGITRKQAKVLNFMIPYGSGDGKIAATLGIPVKDARELRLTFFGKLPKLERLFRGISDTGKSRGYIYNWLGRRLYLSSPDFAYVLPNHLIQSSGADICKKAMNIIDDSEFTSRMLLQLHDELLIESRPEDAHEIHAIQKIMEGVYVPKNGAILRTSVGHSLHGWGSRQLTEGIYGK